MLLKTKPFDSAKYLTDPKDQFELIKEAYESGDVKAFEKSVEIVNRSMNQKQTLWIAGRVFNTDDIKELEKHETTPGGVSQMGWGLNGVFSTREKAVGACQRPNHDFVAEIEKDKFYGEMVIVKPEFPLHNEFPLHKKRFFAGGN